MADAAGGEAGLALGFEAPVQLGEQLQGSGREDVGRGDGGGAGQFDGKQRAGRLGGHGGSLRWESLGSSPWSADPVGAICLWVLQAVATACVARWRKAHEARPDRKTPVWNLTIQIFECDL